jgi:threonine dehydrogenase-like Zn-dependent dehydrogenase
VLLRPGTHVVRVDESLPAGIAAPANCALATAVNAVSHIPDSCRTAVVQGLGLLGIYACVLLREKGVEQVFCVEVQKRRLMRAEAFGGIPVDGRPGRYPAERRRIERAVPHGVDAVVEVAGTADLVSEGIGLLRPGGTYVLAGMVHPDTLLEITGEQVIRKCLTIRGVHNYAPWHLEQAIALLERTADRYPYASLTSSPFALHDLERAVRAAQSRRHFRVAVCPQGLA